MLLFEDELTSPLPQPAKPEAQPKKRASKKANSKDDDAFAGIDIDINMDIDAQDQSTPQQNGELDKAEVFLPDYIIYGNGNAVCEQICNLFYAQKLPRCIMLSGAFGGGKSYIIDVILSKIFANYGFTNDQTNPLHKSNNPDILYVKNGQKDTNLAKDEESAQNQSIKAIYKNNLSVVKDFGQSIMPFLVKSPQISDFKFLVIDNIDYASKEFTNSILKTLEEANFSLYIILVSHNTSRVLKTIMSRSILFNTGSLNQEDFSNILACQQVQLGEDELNTLYSLSDAQPGIAKILINNDYKTIIKQTKDIISGLPQQASFLDHDLFNLGFLSQKTIKLCLEEYFNTPSENDFYKAQQFQITLNAIGKILQNAITYNADETLAKIEISRLLASLTQSFV